MIKKKKTTGVRKEVAIKEDLRKFKEEIIHEFHIISEGLIDQIKLLAEGHSGIIDRLKVVDERLYRVEKGNELLAEGHLGIAQRLTGVETSLDRVETKINGVETRIDHLEKESERQHLETRSLIKISFSELDRRISNLESQVRELQDWRKQVESRPQV